MVFWISLQIPLPTSPTVFALIVFHQGGTVTVDIQGANAFDPSTVSVPPENESYGNNLISTSAHGVWQKTRSNTFAATLMDTEYHNSVNPLPK